MFQFCNWLKSQKKKTSNRALLEISYEKISYIVNCLKMRKFSSNFGKLCRRSLAVAVARPLSCQRLQVASALRGHKRDSGSGDSGSGRSKDRNRSSAYQPLGRSAFDEHGTEAATISVRCVAICFFSLVDACTMRCFLFLIILSQNHRFRDKTRFQADIAIQLLQCATAVVVAILFIKGADGIATSSLDRIDGIATSSMDRIASTWLGGLFVGPAAAPVPAPAPTPAHASAPAPKPT